MQKMDFLSQIIFEIFKFKNMQADLLRAFLHITF